MLARIVEGDVVVWAPPQLIDDVLYPANIEQFWSDAELLAIGLYRVTPGSIPAGHVTTGAPTYQLAGNVVIETIPSAPRVYSQNELRAYAADKRWQTEIGGLVSPTFGPLATDRETQAMIGRIIQSIDLGLVTEPIDYKGPGGFAQVTRAMLVLIGQEVGQHVQACFSCEAAVVAAIAAETITHPDQIDAAAWPSN